MNIMTLVVLAILVVFALLGFRSGMVNRLEGILALAISAMLVSAVLPSVTAFLKEQTPVYQFIQTQCRETVSKLAVRRALGENTLNREEIRSYLSMYGLDGSIVDTYTDSELHDYLERYLPDYLSSQQAGAQEVLGNLTRIEQTKLIQSLPIPSFLQNLMLGSNNSEGYGKLGVSTFGEYLIDFIATLILNIVAFLVTLLVVHVIVWGVFRILNLAAHLPILRTVNRLGGLAVGLLEGIICIWVLFLVISMLSGTSIGMTLQSMVDDSVLLAPLYQGNVLLKLVGNAISGMI